MKIRNIEVGSVIGASGISNFFGDGYPYHLLLKFALLVTPLWVPILRLIKWTCYGEYRYKYNHSIFYQLMMVSEEIPAYPIWFSLRGMTDTTKTIVANLRAGNLKTKKDGITPSEFRPACIYVDMPNKVGVNIVALSCPGVERLLRTGKLQAKEGPTIISIMPVGSTKAERSQEMFYLHRSFVNELPNFRGRIIFQINISCPNTGEELEDYLEEVFNWAKMFRSLVPITVKINTLTPVEVTIRLSEVFDAIFVTNTLPYTLLTKEERDQYFYGASESPLMQHQDKFNVKGPGGVSGAVLLPRALVYVRELRRAGITIPIILGGGILSPDDVDAAKRAGATGISLGSITMIAPWNLQPCIQRANEIFA